MIVHASGGKIRIMILMRDDIDINERNPVLELSALEPISSPIRQSHEEWNIDMNFPDGKQIRNGYLLKKRNCKKAKLMT